MTASALDLEPFVPAPDTPYGVVAVNLPGQRLKAGEGGVERIVGQFDRSGSLHLRVVLSDAEADEAGQGEVLLSHRGYYTIQWDQAEGSA